jgi:hypothetical protein
MATLTNTLRCSIWGLSFFLAASYALPSSAETEAALKAMARSGKRGRRQRGGGNNIQHCIILYVTKAILSLK